MDLSDLYSDKILEIAMHLPAAARLADADGSARKVSRVCGSVIEVDVKLRDGVVAEYGADVSACALGQTSAAVMAQHVVGSTPDELRALRTQMHTMLKDNGTPPTGKWADLRYLEAVREYRPRHMSTLLVFDAVVDAVEAAERAVVP
ncbi:MAG: NifU [Devosia sp.]|nr:NifU [Devosia sp.]